MSQNSVASSPGTLDRPDVSSSGVTPASADGALQAWVRDHLTRTLRSLRLMALAAWRGVGELYNSDGLTHAASIAYYALLSLFPFLLLALSILGGAAMPGSEESKVLNFVFRYFPFRDFTESLITDEILHALGLLVFRVLIPLVGRSLST